MSIFNSKNILVVPSKNLKMADYLSLSVLLDILKKKASQIDMYLDQPFDSALTFAVALPEVKIINKISPRRFVLSFNKGSDNVKNVQWHQTEDKLNVYISTDQGSLNAEGVQIKTEGADYDTVLFYGINDYSQVESIFKSSAALLHETRNISLAGTFAIPHSKVELIRSENGETNPELVYSQCKGQGATPEHYSRLLAAILAATNRFNTQAVKAKTFTVCAELLANGANLARANGILGQKDSTPKPANSEQPKQNPEATKSSDQEPLPPAKS